MNIRYLKICTTILIDANWLQTLAYRVYNPNLTCPLPKTQEQNSIFFRRRFLPLRHLCFSKPPGHKGGKDDIVKELNTTHPVKRKTSLTWRYLQPSSALPDLHLCQIIPPTFGKVEKRLERVKKSGKDEKGFERENTEQVLKGNLERLWKIEKNLEVWEKLWERFWKTISPSTPQSSSVTSHKAFKSFSSPRAITFLGHLWGTYILCICRHVLWQLYLVVVTMEIFPLLVAFARADQPPLSTCRSEKVTWSL